MSAQTNPSSELLPTDFFRRCPSFFLCVHVCLWMFMCVLCSGTHVYQPEVSFVFKPSGTMNLNFETEYFFHWCITHRAGLSRLPPWPHPTHLNLFISTSLALALHKCATTFNYFHMGSGIHACILVLARRELSQLSYLCCSWVCLIEKEWGRFIAETKDYNLFYDCAK